MKHQMLFIFEGELMKNTNIRHTFFKYVSLNIIGMIGLSCYILADTFFVARGIGANGLTALNLVIPIYSFIHGTGLMLGMGGSIRFTISKSDKVFTQTICYTLLAAFIFVVAGAFFSNDIALLLGSNADTLQNATTYLKIILYFSPMFLLNNVVLCFVRNDGNPRLAMTAMLVGSLSNIVLDYVFIFPFKLGMFGAALATGIAPIVSLIILSSHFIKKNNTFRLIKQKFELKSFTDIARLGISALITELSSGIVIIVFNTIILKLEGNTGVAAYGIIANISLVVVSVFTGIAQGMQPIISLSHREKKSDDINRIMKYGIITAVCFAAVVYILSFVFAQPIVAAFNKDGNAHLTQIAVNGLRIYFTAFAFVGINIVCATYFSSINSPKNAFIISLLRGFAVIVPITFILAAIFGINGVWAAMTVSELAVFLVTAGMMSRAKQA